jgi:hypothetical protein
MGIAAMHDARAYAGAERRRNQVLVTENREYHCRDGWCVAVRDRQSRMFIRNHSAIGRRLTGAMRLSPEGAVQEVSLPESLVAGEKLCFSSCDGDLEHDVITSSLVAIERPAKSIVAVYDELRA